MTLKSKPIIRLYSMPDENMTTRAQTKHDLLVDDLADFTAKFPFIDMVWVNSYQSDITTAINYQSDTVQVNLIKVLTEDVQTSVAEGMKALDTLDIYAKLAFPDSPAKQRVFGQDNWDKARNDQQKMVKALKSAHTFADEAAYKTALTGKGYTLPEIAALLTIADNINTKDALQEKAKAGRPVVTEDRIDVHNIVWGRDQTLKTMAELVYRDNAAKLDQYLLYPAGSGELTKVIVHVTAMIMPQYNATVQLTNTPLAAQQTDANGNAVFASVNMPDSVDIKVVLADSRETERPDQAVVQGAETTIDVVFP